jgi:signal transduction histidine kinase
MIRYLFLFVFFCFTSTISYSKIIISDSTERVLIGKSLSVLQPNKELNINEVQQSNQFVPCLNDIPNLGLSASSVWLKFTILNQSSNSHFLLNLGYPILDEVELFTSDSILGYKSVLMGEIKSYHDRKYNHPNYIFDIDIAQSQTNTYYVRIKSTEQIIVPISINKSTVLWELLGQEDLISGIYLGIILIMIFYNLFLFFSVKDRSYLYYVLYVLFAGLTQIGIKGYNFKYLWPDFPSFELKSVILFACMSCIAAILFTRRFLLTKQNAPKSNIAFSVLIVIFIVGIVATLVGKAQIGFQIMQQSTSLFSLGVLSVSFMVMIKGYKPANYFFAAWSVLLIGSILFLLKDYGILPYNTFTSYSMQGASAIEMALLSFGLANSINILKKEKEASQNEALRISKENERIIKEQNVMLEIKVEERTHELQETNEELHITLEDLKQAQSQLVESEKMASLGQLTAGIAHEINNPINFVTSNVTPLRRDVAMLLDALNNIEIIGLSELSIAEKQKKIDDYKEDLDFDYLKEEVEHLLKGIYEGASRTAEIVKGLRIFSRVDEDDLKRADLNEGLDSTIVIINNLLGNKIEIVKDYAILPLIECYPGKLNQVFLNIITNAIHAIHQQFGEQIGGKIWISTASNDKDVIVKIKDNGIGMDEKTKHKIFEPFFTTKEVGEGTGLGMSIAYNTVKKHNGQIFMESNLGEGTEFTLHIPIIYEVPAL